MTAEAPAEAGRRRGRSAPRHGRKKSPAGDPGTHRCMVLACGTDDTTGVDLTTGAVVRLRIDWTDEREADLSPFRHHRCGVGRRSRTRRPGPTRGGHRGGHAGAYRHHERTAGPSGGPPPGGSRGTPPAGLPRYVGTVLGVPRDAPVRGSRRPPSRALCSSVARPTALSGPGSAQRAATTGCPVEDRRAMAALWTSRRDRLSGKGLSTALGFRAPFHRGVHQPAARRPLLQDGDSHSSPP
jgi:hypothetical protein